jgi:hypothetical protein
MNTQTKLGRQRHRLVLTVAAAAAALALAVATGCGDDPDPAVGVAEASAAVHYQSTAHDSTEHATAHHSTAAPQVHTESAHAFQDEMRNLWEQHVTWTRLAIVSFVDDLPDLKPTVARLLANQTDIGNAIKPYYGDEAGERLTALLEGHINGAVDLLSAAKSGTNKQVKKASAAWYRNGNQIADFLSNANPDNWPRADMRTMMRTHLDQTLAEATQRLTGHHRAEIRTYDEIEDHILEMADALSDGIVAQFPGQFQ